MPPHRALEVYEILSEILEQLSPSRRPLPQKESTYSRLSTRRSLSSSARVCTLWSDVALKVLWAERGSVKPLLNLFSSFDAQSALRQRTQVNFQDLLDVSSLT
ncbi:hypothetical protein OBBRIDRAFT_172719 [Obba rivulosa]|uniref:F-box domain-containing protein n=1 Tax=Obba rivulosa TaxID=1052685 RepID=A0A8E2ASA5_9APHY|nr:hypothetical protein OBBRIDRAFT_172719 [Obba rivulosa]